MGDETTKPTRPFPIVPTSSAFIGFLGGAAAMSAFGQEQDLKQLVEIIPQLGAMGVLTLMLLYIVFVANPKRDDQYRSDLQRQRDEHIAAENRAWEYVEKLRETLEAALRRNSKGE